MILYRENGFETLSYIKCLLKCITVTMNGWHNISFLILCVFVLLYAGLLKEHFSKKMTESGTWTDLRVPNL